MKLKCLFIILATFVLCNSFVTLVIAARTSKPDNGQSVIIEVKETIEKLIASNQESSQKIEEMTSEIQRLTTTLVGLTWLLILITLLPFGIRFSKWMQARKKQTTIKKKKAYPVYKLRRIRLQ